MMNIQLTQYAWFKPRRVIGITLSVAILFAPSPLLAEGVCIQQIMYGKDPETGQWELLPNPCVIPAGWTETSPTLPEGVSIKGEVTGTSSTDSSAGCPAQITYAKPRETSQKWYIFSTPCDVPDGWIKADNDKMICAVVVVYAQNPTSENWFSFVTPCDVPADWTKTSYTKPENIVYKDCSKSPQAGYAKSPKTGNWYEFANLCDAPQNWNPDGVKPEKVEPFNPQVVDCPPTLTYAQRPTSKHWYAFATPCDVPAGWEKVGVVQQEEASTGESCEAFYASYSFTEGKLEIPRIWVNGLSEKPSLYEKIQMQHVGDIDSPNFSYFLFSFDIKMSLQPITPSQ